MLQKMIIGLFIFTVFGINNSFAYNYSVEFGNELEQIKYDEFEEKLYAEPNTNADYVGILYSVAKMPDYGDLDKKIDFGIDFIETVNTIVDINTSSNSIDALQSVMDFVFSDVYYLDDIFISILKDTSENVGCATAAGDHNAFILNIKVKEDKFWLDEGIEDAAVSIMRIKQAVDLKVVNGKCQWNFDWLDKPDTQTTKTHTSIGKYVFQGISAGVYMINVNWKGVIYTEYFAVGPDAGYNQHDYTFLISRTPRGVIGKYTEDDDGKKALWVGSFSASHILYTRSYAIDGTEPSDPRQPDIDDYDGKIDGSSGYISIPNFMDGNNHIWSKYKFIGYNESVKKYSEKSEMLVYNIPSVKLILSSNEFAFNSKILKNSDDIPLQILLKEENGIESYIETISVLAISESTGESYNLIDFDDVTIDGGGHGVAPSQSCFLRICQLVIILFL